MRRLVILQVRGPVGVKRTVKTTLNNLRLFTKNSCSIVNDTPCNIGMLTLIKDVITWGEIDKETLKLLLLKRGRLPGNVLFTEEYLQEKLKIDIDTFCKDILEFKRELKDVPGLKLYFRLKPPIKGFERGGIKRPYSMGGSLGYRKNTINELLRRML